MEQQVAQGTIWSISTVPEKLHQERNARAPLGISLPKIGVVWEGYAAMPPAACTVLLGARTLAADMAGHDAVAPQPAGIQTHIFPTQRVKFSFPSRKIVERPLENAAFKERPRI